MWWLDLFRGYVGNLVSFAEFSHAHEKKEKKKKQKEKKKETKKKEIIKKKKSVELHDDLIPLRGTYAA